MSARQNIFHFVFITVLVTLLHFTYEWSGENVFVGLFSAVNESTWEHLKLLFFPMLFLTVLQCTFRSGTLPADFLSARLYGIVCGMSFITVSFYTIRGVFGEPFDPINIALYFIGVIDALWKENRALQKKSALTDTQAALLLLVITAAFFIFTNHPPAINLFRSP